MKRKKTLLFALILGLPLFSVRAASGDPPSFLTAAEVPGDLFGFRLVVDEPLCEDPIACGSDAASPFNWRIQNVNDPTDDLVVQHVAISETTLQFTCRFPRTAGATYKILVDPEGFGVADRLANFLAPGTSITAQHGLLFQQGIDGYFATEDLELATSLGETSPVNGLIVRVDSDPGFHGLLRFGNVVGNGPGKIPFGCTITSAKLILQHNAISASGGPVSVHRLRQAWSEGVVPPRWVRGIQPDGTNAAVAPDFQIMTVGLPVPFTLEQDVTSAVQAWARGELDFGWAFLPESENSYVFDSSESANPPALQVYYEDIIADSCNLTFVQQPPPFIPFIIATDVTLTAGISCDGFCLLNFQWTKNGIAVPGATNLLLNLAFVSCADAGTYRLHITSGSQSWTSNPVVLDPVLDRMRPRLLGAMGDLAGTNVLLTFSQTMDAITAQDVNRYSFVPPLAVSRALLSADATSVTLTTARRNLTTYRLQIEGVTDGGCGGGSLISPNPSLVDIRGVRSELAWDASWFYTTNSQDHTLASIPWNSSAFTGTNGWATGSGLFGHEVQPGIVARLPAPILTPVPPNATPPYDQVTSYFRREIKSGQTAGSDQCVLCHVVDDGAIFYLDGTEIARVNMTNLPPVIYSDRAATMVEASVICIPIVPAPAGGTHTLAVEVHQGGPTSSSDVLFGAQILTLAGPPPELTVVRTAVGVSLRWTADSSWELVRGTSPLGPYTPVQVQRLGFFDISSSDNFASAFFQLRFCGGQK